MNEMEENLIVSKIINPDVKSAISEIVDLERTSIFKRYWPYKKNKKEVHRSEKSFKMNVESYQLDEFKEHFRMSRTTFESLLKLVASEVAIQNEPVTRVSIENKLLFTIWCLSKQESYMAIAERFGIGKSPGRHIFCFCIKILSKLMPIFVKWPDKTMQVKNAKDFYKKSKGMIGVFGAIDSCHIPIKEPAESPSDFLNSKQFHSIILQGVCNTRYQFIDVFIGKPGRMNASQVFQTSPLYPKITAENNIFIDSNLHIIGDSAYPLCVNLLTPYCDNDRLLPKQVGYNTRLMDIHYVIERSFTLLKGNFQRLKYLDEQSTSFSNNIISACCMLHNFIISKEEVDDSITCEPDELHLDSSFEKILTSINKEASTEATKKRDSIIHLI